MIAQIDKLLKPLNLTLHNCKVLDDFSGILGLLASAPNELRDALAESLMEMALRADNVHFVQAILTIDDIRQPARIRNVLINALTRKRAIRENSKVTPIVLDLWNSADQLTRTEIVAMVFSTTANISADKDFELQSIENSVKTLAMLNGGNVDRCINTMLFSLKDAMVMRSQKHITDLMEILAYYVVHPAYDDNLLDSIEIKRSELPNYTNSLKHSIDSCIEINNPVQLNKLLMENIYQFPEVIVDAVISNPKYNWFSGYHSSLVKTIISGDWCKDGLNDKFKSLLDYVVDHPAFEANVRINPALRIFTGHANSCYVAEKLANRDIKLQAPLSSFGEDEVIFHSVVAKNENANKGFKKAIIKIAVKIPSISKFADAFDLLKQSGQYALPDGLNKEDKIAIMAALLYYENNSSKPIPRAERPAEMSLKQLKQDASDPFFMVSGISLWIAQQLSPETIYQLKPDDSKYLKGMMDLGLLGMEYVECLDGKHKRQILDADMGL